MRNISELTQKGLNVIRQMPIDVYYHGEIVGSFFADLLVNELIILELKAAKKIEEAHLSQLSNYLSATQIEVGLLLNFGPRPQFKRRVFSNDRKILLKSV